MAHRKEDLLAAQLGLFEEATLLDRLSEQQGELVSEALARAAEGELALEERARLKRDLEGSWDRIQEVHHRIRNHLQTLTGLLSAQEVAERSPSARRALQKGVARLTSIAVIHDLLARDPSSGELSLPDLAEKLARHLVRQADAARRIRVRCRVDPLALSSRDATALVLVLTELLSNAIEHGLPGEREGEIEVRIEGKGEEAVLEVSDNGCGLPEGFELEQGDSLGLRLVKRLAERDLSGSVRAWSEGGARFRVTFPTPASGGEQ